MLQVSDRIQHCPFLFVRNLQQNRSCYRWKSDFLVSLIHETLQRLGQALLQTTIWISHWVLGFWGDPCYVLLNKITIGWESSGSIQTMGTVNGKWRKQFTHLVSSKAEGPTFIFVTHFTPTLRLVGYCRFAFMNNYSTPTDNYIYCSSSGCTVVMSSSERVIHSASIDWLHKPSQAKPSQAKVLTGERRLTRSASRRPPVC